MQCGLEDDPLTSICSRFLGQSRTAKNDWKVPSVVCYDQEGTVVAVGSATDIDVNPDIGDMEDIGEVVRVEWDVFHVDNFDTEIDGY